MKQEAKTELSKWIEGNVVVDYWLVHQSIAPGGLEALERHGMGRLRRLVDNIIELVEPSGQRLIVTVTGREIIDYCEPQVGGGGYRVQVHTPTYSTWMAFKLSEYVY